MRKPFALLAALSMAVGGVALTGCDTGEDTYQEPDTGVGAPADPGTTTPPAGQDTGTGDRLRDTGDTMREGARDTGQTLKQGAQETGETIKEGARQTGDAVKEGLQETQEGVKQSEKLLEETLPQGQQQPQQPPQQQ